LAKESFESFKNVYADIIISCGSSAVAANVFLKYENNAKNIVIMKPGFGRSKKIDLIILPRHDVLRATSDERRATKNILITEGAPNRIRATSDERRTTNNGIGLLIGGDAKGFRLKKEDVEKVVDEVIKISEEKNLDIFLSTSRRTSPQIDKLLKEKLGNNKRCKLLIIANEKNIEGAAANIFGLSELVIISQESVSMISEAASSGRYVIVFKSRETNDERRTTKYGSMVSNLEKNGYINTAKPDEIYDRIKEILETRPEQKKLDDREKITERLKGII
jgi:mitochondrial fission protein ELM1